MNSELLAAAAHLNSGRCVAMPTETVYGLAARVDSDAGIAAIFRLKERPSFDPLIAHIANLNQIPLLAREWPHTASSLAEKFWPGPLTIVVPKQLALNPMITSGLDTVGIRMPSHPLALELIEAAAMPLAAPSANRFGRTSPTSASHVRTEFPEAVASKEILVLDGGESAVGVESTVCLVTEDSVTILRPGGVTEDELRAHFQAQVDPKLRDVTIGRAVSHQASPGHTEHHYETAKPLIVSWGPALDHSRADYVIEGRKVQTSRVLELSLPLEPSLAARQLYALLRQGDLDASSDALFIRRDLSQSAGQTGLWLAIDDRLKRAARLQLADA